MASIADLNAKLDAAGEGSQPWKATKEGDQIAGTVTVVGSFSHAEYGTSATLTIETENGSVIMDGKAIKEAGVMRTLMAGAVLGGFYSDYNPSVGDFVAIRFLGKKQGSGSSKPYNNYATVCEKPTASDKLDSAGADASDFV